jgi:hypothetical protein
MAEGWAEATQGVRWLGVVCGSKSASEWLGRETTREGLSARLFTRVCHSEVGRDEIGDCGPLFAGCQQRTSDQETDVR